MLLAESGSSISEILSEPTGTIVQVNRNTRDLDVAGLSMNRKCEFIINVRKLRRFGFCPPVCAKIFSFAEVQLAIDGLRVVVASQCPLIWRSSSQYRFDNGCLTNGSHWLPESLAPIVLYCWRGFQSAFGNTIRALCDRWWLFVIDLSGKS